MKTIVCKHNVIWANNAAAENAGLMTTSVAFSSSSICLLILILSKWEIIFMVFYLGRVSHFLFLNTELGVNVLDFKFHVDHCISLLN